MSENYDFKKEWEKTKGQLSKFSKDVLELAKKGEEELVKFSHQSKLHIDATAAGLRKERLMHLIGKEYVKCSDLTNPSDKVKKLVDEFRQLEKEQKDLRRKAKSAAKNTVKKSAKKTSKSSKK